MLCLLESEGYMVVRVFFLEEGGPLARGTAGVVGWWLMARGQQLAAPTMAVVAG